MDEVDAAQYQIEQGLEMALKNIDPVLHGDNGECEECGEVGRLVGGLCVNCRNIEEQRKRKWKS